MRTFHALRLGALAAAAVSLAGLSQPLFGQTAASSQQVSVAPPSTAGSATSSGSLSAGPSGFDVSAGYHFGDVTTESFHLNGVAVAASFKVTDMFRVFGSWNFGHSSSAVEDESGAGTDSTSDNTIEGGVVTRWYMGTDEAKSPFVYFGAGLGIDHLSDTVTLPDGTGSGGQSSFVLTPLGGFDYPVGKMGSTPLDVFGQFSFSRVFATGGGVNVVGITAGVRFGFPGK